jgi:NADPH:quinone reductase-like Zn-dependent oxidoreductase
MKAAVFEAFGEPSAVLNVHELPDPLPGPGQVRVRMIASPINPSDLLVVRGRYGVLPRLPATPGFEGVGFVDLVGPGLLGRLVKGKRVASRMIFRMSRPRPTSSIRPRYWPCAATSSRCPEGNGSSSQRPARVSAAW